MTSHVYIYNLAKKLGIPVIDSKDRQFVGVTPDDVLQARKANSKHCALARAALRLTNVHAAYFFRTMAFLEYADRIVRFKLPDSVQKEIVTYDRAQIFAPGVYQLTPPPKSSGRAVMAAHKRDLTAGRKQVQVRPTKPKERAALKAAIAIVEKAAPAETQKLATIQGLKPVKPEVQLSTGTKLKATAAKALTNAPTATKEPARLSGITTKKAAIPLLPNGRFYRKSQYVRELDEPI